MPDHTAESLIDATIRALAAHAPFDRMQAADLDLLARRVRLGYYPAGSELFSPQHGPADRLFVVKSGAVLGGHDHDDARLQLSSGESFPLGALLAGRGVANTYRAAVDTFCWELAASDFHALVERSVVFRDFCTRRIADLLEQSHGHTQAEYSRKLAADSPLEQPLDRIMHPPVACVGDTALSEALAIMHRDRVGSMLVVDAQGAPLGIFTLEDLLRHVVQGLDPQRPIGEFMHRGVHSLPPESDGAEAALLMARHGVRHLPVVAQGRLVGVVSERDLFRMQRLELASVSDGIRRCTDVAALLRHVGDVQELAHAMLAQGVGAERLTQLVSTLNDQVTARLITLEWPRAEVSVPVCWLAFGSEGRREQTLATDQDNGIVFDAPAADAQASRSRLLEWAEAINRELDKLGFPLCRGGIMAGNPDWCLTREEWQQCFGRWIHQGAPDDLLNASIFFDLRGLWGDTGLADDLRRWLVRQSRAHDLFRRRLAANALANRPPLGVVRDFVVGSHQGRAHTLDLKINGTTPFTDAARILALAAGVEATGTAERLRRAAPLLSLEPAAVSAWIEAFYFILMLRLRQQHQDREQGRAMSNLVDPDELNDLDRRILKEAFRQARKLQTRLALDYNL